MTTLNQKCTQLALNTAIDENNKDIIDILLQSNNIGNCNIQQAFTFKEHRKNRRRRNILRESRQSFWAE